MKRGAKVEDISAEIDAALALLDEYATDHPSWPVRDSFPSLLEQCKAMSASFPGVEPVRSLHHLACTGGTLIAKCLAVLPGAVLLNEIDPLSTIRLTESGRKPPFAPTDLFISLRQSIRQVGDDVIAAGFQAAVSATATLLARRGQYLIIRDHSHSHFCTRIAPPDRPSVHEMLSEVHPLLSAVTVRHPLDSFISLQAEAWIHFSPPTLDEYSLRYGMFLDRHQGLPVLQYEDFVRDPAAELTKLCQILNLPFNPAVLDLFPIVRVSGDSGRSGAQIAPRPRRPVPGEIERQRTGEAYRSLCRRMGYEP